MATDSDGASGADEREAITVYSDYVCPFCYLGRRSLASYQETREEPLEVDWHPFDLRAGQRGPDGEIDRDADTGKDEEYYEQARENVRRLQEEYGADEMEVELAATCSPTSPPTSTGSTPRSSTRRSVTTTSAGA